MIRHRAKLLLAVLCMSCMLFPTSCTPSTPPPDPVTITFAYSDEYDEVYQALAQEFHAGAPEITVELHPVRTGLFDNPEFPVADVFMLPSFVTGELREQESILSLTPLIAQDTSFDMSDFYPGAVDLFTAAGETWALPAEADVLVMVYNKDLFDAYGVAYPTIGWNWEDFLDAAIALRDPDAGVFGYITSDQMIDAMMFIHQHGGQIVDDWQNPTRCTFDDPLTIEALEWYADLIHEHNVSPTLDQIRRDLGGNIESAIYQGQIGMWTHMISQCGEASWGSRWVMRWGVAPLPSDRQSATLALVDGYFISSQAQNPEACWKWITFLSGKIPPGTAPVRISLIESAEYERQVGTEVATVVRTSMETAGLVPSALAEMQEELSLFGEALFSILNGDASAEEALLNAQRQAEALSD